MRKISNRIRSDQISLEKQRDYFHREMDRLNKDLEYCPFVWSFSTKISESGDITVTFFERDKSSRDTAFYQRVFSLEETITLLEKHHKHSDVYAWPTIEGKFQDFISKTLNTASRSITEEYLETPSEKRSFVQGVLSDFPLTAENESGVDFIQKYRKKFKIAVRYEALLSALHSSGAYDSPYGGSKNSVFDLPSFLRK